MTSILAVVLLLISVVTIKAQDPYTVSDATTYLMYSYSAYCDPQGLNDWSCFWCTYEDVPSISVHYVFSNASSNTLGYAGVTDDAVIFAFRGTEATSLKNWISDLESEWRVPFHAYPNASVGVGFYNAYMGVNNQVIAAAQQLRNQYPNYPFIFVGHSMGAALTVLAAADIYWYFNDNSLVMKTWNYGNPRIGDQIFADMVDDIMETSYRTTNVDDIVPHVPFQFSGFVHEESEIWWNNETHYDTCVGQEDPNCSDSVIAIHWSISDHLEYLGYDQTLGEQHNCH